MTTKITELPIFVKWYDLLKKIMLITDKFSKHTRFTFVDRIQTLCLVGLEELIAARYSRAKLPHLQDFNLKLENLRVLLRLCHELGYLPHRHYETLAKELSEIGRMLGGWVNQQKNQDG
jgi:four helix bundle protein